MARDEHAPFLENISAYAIGALDAEEIPALESHLETCASCRTELAEYRALNESLLTAIPPKRPSAALRKRLQSRLPGAQRSTPPQWTFSFSRLALGLAVIALFALNLFSFMQLRQIESQQARLLDQVENAQAVLAILSSPNVRMLTLSGEQISGSLLLDTENNRAVLLAYNLPPLAENQTYQVWLIEPDESRVSAGLFRPESGGTYTTQTISPPRSFANYMGIGVTIEPAGGSDQPTGERVFRVDF